MEMRRMENVLLAKFSKKNQTKREKRVSFIFFDSEDKKTN